MRIVCIGGGPGGLYFGLLMKKAHPRADISVFERNRQDDTFELQISSCTSLSSPNVLILSSKSAGFDAAVFAVS